MTRTIETLEKVLSGSFVHSYHGTGNFNVVYKGMTSDCGVPLYGEEWWVASITFLQAHLRATKDMPICPVCWKDEL